MSRPPAQGGARVAHQSSQPPRVLSATKNNPTQTRALHAYLRWRNDNARDTTCWPRSAANAPGSAARRASAGADERESRPDHSLTFKVAQSATPSSDSTGLAVLSTSSGRQELPAGAALVRGHHGVRFSDGGPGCAYVAVVVDAPGAGWEQRGAAEAQPE